MTEAPPSRTARRAQLLVCDIRLDRQPSAAGQTEVQATVECPIDQCTKHVEHCATCVRFVRIDVHEAGYTMVCRGTDSEQKASPEPDPTQ